MAEDKAEQGRHLRGRCAERGARQQTEVRVGIARSVGRTTGQGKWSDRLGNAWGRRLGNERWMKRDCDSVECKASQGRRSGANGRMTGAARWRIVTSEGTDRRKRLFDQEIISSCRLPQRFDVEFEEGRRKRQFGCDRAGDSLCEDQMLPCYPSPVRPCRGGGGGMWRLAYRT